jgi:hypothetical protein
MSFIFNLHTVPIGRCRCLSSRSRHDLVDCERKVVERSQKATSVPETKKMAKPSMKLLDDRKIPTSKSSPWWLPQTFQRRRRDGSKAEDILSEKTSPPPSKRGPTKLGS